MISILIQVIICGIATAAICRTIVYYDGPFHVLSRFQRSLLPPDYLTERVIEVKDIDDLTPKFSKILMEKQTADSKREMWATYHTLYNPKFYLSFKGTLYGVLECPFCLGPYVSVLMAALTTGYVIMVTPISWATLLNFLIVSFGSFGLHFLISKRWEAATSV